MPVVIALARLDRRREGGAERRLVVLGHRAQPELVAALLGQAEADQAAPVRGHEVDRLGRRELGGDRQVALVLAVGRVDDDDELARRGCPRSPPRSWRTRAAQPSSPCSDRSPGEPLDVLGEHVDLEVDLVAGRERAERRHRERVRDERDREAVVVERGDRQRDAVDGDRALLDAVAEDALRARRPRPALPSPSGSTERTRPTPSTWPWT